MLNEPSELLDSRTIQTTTTNYKPVRGRKKETHSERVINAYVRTVSSQKVSQSDSSYRKVPVNAKKPAKRPSSAIHKPE